jgi:hypothetical protein
MAIIDKNAVEEIITKKDRVFLQDMLIAQERLLNIINPPKYSVTINYKTYSTDADGNHEYSAKPKQLAIRDFYAEAVAKAQKGNMKMINALGAIELAISDILNDQTDMDTEVE